MGDIIMNRKIVIAAILLSAALIGGCGEKSSVQEPGQAAEADVSEITGITGGSDETETPSEQTESQLPDGTYTAEFKTDSSMFHVSEACDGKGTLTVENGQMTIHISLGSKKIVNLYSGLAEDAGKDGAKLLIPTEDSVTYSDGMTEEVYGFDVPVPVLETEFDLALVGTKGKWYDHKVSVSDPVPLQEEPLTEPSENAAALADGIYTVGITFEGGSGKATILSPVSITVTDGEIIAAVEWSSPNYDYMLVAGEKYLPVNTEGNSVFEIPVPALDEPMEVIGDTVAMSKPHEVEYTITFHSDTIQE